MSEMDRRGALRIMFGGAILAGAGVSLWPQDAAALADVRLVDQPAGMRLEPAGPLYAQQTAQPFPPPAHRPPHHRPPHRPPPRPPSWHRRRRRWVCWWHRGRRHCGWRWH